LFLEQCKQSISYRQSSILLQLLVVLIKSVALVKKFIIKRANNISRL